MYELTCPSCHQSHRLPFIRIGARSVCRQCQFAWIIKQDHVLRRPPGTVGDAEALPASVASTPPPPSHAKSPATATGANLASLAARHADSAPAAAPASTPTAGGNVAGMASSMMESPAAQMATIASTAVPTASPVAGPMIPPISRLIATKARQNRRRRTITWMTLVIVALLFGMIAAMLVGLNSRQPPADNTAPSASPGPAEAQLILSRVGPPQWKEVEELAYEPTRYGPLNVVDLSVNAIPGSEDYLLTGTVVSASFDTYDNARLQLMLIDGDQQVYARADIALPPLASQRDAMRQPVRIVIPGNLHARLSQVEWDIIAGQPMYEGVVLSPNRITRAGSGKQTQLRLVYVNRQKGPIYELGIFIRALDEQGQSPSQWAGQWRGMLEPSQTIELVIPTPLEENMSGVRDWQVFSAAELSNTLPSHLSPAP